ncbi:MAG: hypothetical protein H6658_02965 [Ardenticatenaceae bacterium]|nr:hypothetical protein [Ardenticatenaceae bacterium]
METNDTTADSVLVSKTIAAFKGLINTYRLEPDSLEEESVEPGFKTSGRYFTNPNNETFFLVCEEKSFDRVLNFVEKLFPGQTDNRLVSQSLQDSLSDWITKGKNPQNQLELENHGLEFIENIKKDIKPRLVFLPVEGLEFKSDASLALGNCKLFNNHSDSDFKQVLQQERKRRNQAEPLESHWSNRAKSYLTFEVTAHPSRAIERGIEEANLALNILKLFISSYYHDENSRSIVRRMGLSGSVYRNELMRVYCIDPTLPIVEQYPAPQMSRTYQKNFEIDNQYRDYIKGKGLEQVNSLIQSLELNVEAHEIARRLVRAITWFAKATNAKSIADSYLMYAIAIEGLLSEDRTPKETYAIRIAALVTRQGENCLIHPIGGYLSSDFANQLKLSSTLSECFDIIRKRVVDLFSYRNSIAHGTITDHEINGSDLLDFETLVRNSILSFVKNEWQTFKEFKNWVDKSVGYDFTPIPRDI